jgi:hypothetical protein
MHVLILNPCIHIHVLIIFLYKIAHNLFLLKLIVML